MDFVFVGKKMLREIVLIGALAYARLDFARGAVVFAHSRSRKHPHIVLRVGRGKARVDCGNASHIFGRAERHIVVRHNTGAV